MSAERAIELNIDHRECDRVPVRGTLRYLAADGSAGQGLWRNASGDGARIHIGRRVRPGQWLEIETLPWPGMNAAVIMRGRVVWCRPATDGKTFSAGVRVDEGDPLGALAVTARQTPFEVVNEFTKTW